MKRSEAMDKLREVRDRCFGIMNPATLNAVDQLLTAEEEADADLLWRLIDDVNARAYASECLGGDGPTQPVCDDEDEPTESKGCPGCGGLTEWDREDPPNPYYCDECAPWDDIPAFEGDPDDCKFSDACKADIGYAIATPAQLREFARQNAQKLCRQDTLPITPDPPRLVPVTEQIVEVDGKYYRVDP